MAVLGLGLVFLSMYWTDMQQVVNTINKKMVNNVRRADEYDVINEKTHVSS